MRQPSREDRRRAAQQQLEELLLEGLDSGPAKEWTRADVDALRAEVHERMTGARRDAAMDPPGDGS